MGNLVNTCFLRYIIFVANVDSLDWKNPGSDKITERVLSKAGPGSIILFHNAAKDTPGALPSVIEGLIKKGYSFAPVSELIHKGAYTIDHTGRQFAEVTTPSVA